MGDPKHNGPACAGHCEGAAYQIEIRQLKDRIAELELVGIELIKQAFRAESERDKLQAAINRLADPIDPDLHCNWNADDDPDYELRTRIEYAQEFATEMK